MITDEDTTARLGTAASGLTATGAITVKAAHEGEYSTAAKAVAAGSTAVGASIALNIVLSLDTLAEVARNVQGTSVSVIADSSTNSEAHADATAKGADGGDDDADKKKQDQVDNNPNTNTQGHRHAADREERRRHERRHRRGQQPDRRAGRRLEQRRRRRRGLDQPQLGRDDEQGEDRRRRAPSPATSGEVKVSAENSSEESAKSTGLAAASRARTSPRPSASTSRTSRTTRRSARTRSSRATAITVEAVNTGDKENDLIVWGLAGSARRLEQERRRQRRGVDRRRGRLLPHRGVGRQGRAPDLERRHRRRRAERDRAPEPGALRRGLEGRRGGRRRDRRQRLPGHHDEAFIDSTVIDQTQVDALGEIKVSAKSYVKEAPGRSRCRSSARCPPFSSVAVAGGASTGGAAVSGSVIVDVFFITTKATIATGTRINQHPERLTGRAGSSQTLKVLGAGRHVDHEPRRRAQLLDQRRRRRHRHRRRRDRQAGLGDDRLNTRHRRGGGITVYARLDRELPRARARRRRLDLERGRRRLGHRRRPQPGRRRVASAQVGGTVHAGGSFDITASDDLTDSPARGRRRRQHLLGRRGRLRDRDRPARQRRRRRRDGANLQANGGTGLSVKATQTRGR